MDLVPALVITYFVGLVFILPYSWGKMDVNGYGFEVFSAIIWPLTIVYKILMIPLGYVYNLGKKHEKKAMEYKEYHAEISAKMDHYRKLAEKEVRELTLDLNAK